MKIIKAKNVTTAEKNLVAKYTKMCLREMAKKEHEIDWSYQQLLNGITVKIKNRGQCSYGGINSITIDVCYIRRNSTELTEYRAYARDPVIGDVDDITPELVLLGVVAHEVAHYIQDRCGPYTRWLKKTYRKPHGEGFQAIYRILRSRIVNPLIEQERSAEAA
jgi:hypothetical protein